MLILVGKLDDLVFNRRAIARSATLDLPAVHWGAVQVVLNQLMDLRIGPSDPARDLIDLKVIA